MIYTESINEKDYVRLWTHGISENRNCEVRINLGKTKLYVELNDRDVERMYEWIQRKRGNKENKVIGNV